MVVVVPVDVVMVLVDVVVVVVVVLVVVLVVVVMVVLVVALVVVVVTVAVVVVVWVFVVVMVVVVTVDVVNVVTLVVVVNVVTVVVVLVVVVLVLVVVVLVVGHFGVDNSQANQLYLFLEDLSSVASLQSASERMLQTGKFVPFFVFRFCIEQPDPQSSLGSYSLLPSLVFSSEQQHGEAASAARSDSIRIRASKASPAPPPRGGIFIVDFLK